MSKGLPGRLPAGERILWQGAPSWRTLLRSMFHIRAVAAYFALIIAWCAASYLREGDGAGAVAMSVLRMGGVALVPIVLTAIYAWLLQRTTVYTITTRRIVLHHGIAFPMSINLPFARIAAAALATHADGSGDVPVSLTEGSKVAFLAVWPNARPWRMRNPEPMLRGIKDAASVAQILSRALAASADMPVSAQTMSSAVAPQTGGATVAMPAAAAA